MKKTLRTLVLGMMLATSTEGAFAHGDTAALERDYKDALAMADDCMKAFGDDGWAARGCRENALRAGLAFHGHMTCHIARENIESCSGHPRR